VKMSRLSERIVQRLRKEGVVWDRERTRESDLEVTTRLDEAQPFRVSRPAREPVSVRLDPQDIFLLKRLARRRGIPSSQLIALWVHERVAREAKRRVG
jgi:hypothetical protein